ncbi:MAG: FKBP-type peptidyl-prolyl cis-trans isomerase [Culturomica sp.]|jgi:FKBP-type peptidyl-prolyl cis-trans isomerase SlyD|nr:FKBP-type peptidyl-prolyl cis-trans isomerase [Culturomica sp.]
MDEMITKNKMVTVSYELRTEPEGELLERATPENPLEFICGQGQTLEYFEMNLYEKKKGDKFNFKIASQNAYGQVDEDMIVDLPKEIFKEVEEEDMTVGNVLPMTDSLGRRLMGKIEAIGDDEIKINFNHPLAGEDLYFTGEVLDVRDATDEELEALHHHCGGGCGSCGGGCGEDEGGCGCTPEEDHCGCCH